MYLHLHWVTSHDPDQPLPVGCLCGGFFGNDEATSPPEHNNGNGAAAGSGFNQLRNEFLTAACRVSTSKKQAIGEVVEWASGGAFKYGDVGRMTETDAPKLRAANELMASALAGTAR